MIVKRGPQLPLTSPLIVTESSELSGNWTWDEFYPIHRMAVKMEESVPHRVDVIVDLRHGLRMPADSLNQVRQMVSNQPENIRLIILVSTNVFVMALYRMGTRIDSRLSYHFRMVCTLDEAYRMITGDRALQPG